MRILFIVLVLVGIGASLVASSSSFFAGEEFSDHFIVPMSGDDETDHDCIVAKKLELYSAFPGCAFVECSCMSFDTFVLNEPHVRIPASRFSKVLHHPDSTAPLSHGLQR